ncbi:PTS mannitol transporter subunit IICB [Oceanobacillus timonensis]|uniref:PTS mannitol transporter subunit IICB n=1 Tax=Oceanobacillus timonensis TaxID=1926285 RepID=UPI0009B9EC17|nr:PTS mannitol transporter subunit IICB [Oceanobacillus timonensis]
MDATLQDKEQKGSLKAKIQKMGNFLSSMVIPNIGAFIAWGLLTALFIPDGWIPNEHLAELVDPTMTYMLPLLLGYTGGFNVYGKRGGVAGALGTIGVIIGADITMLIGGMVMGPLSALIFKKLDPILKRKIKPGLEMLMDTFSLGIIGALLMVVGFIIVNPIFTFILTILSNGVEWVMEEQLLPLASIFVAPAQVLFLNNAVNHGIMIPLGIEQVQDVGKSVLFLVEGNGGNWFGVVLAFSIFAKGSVTKRSAAAASPIQLFGGIGEVAFPFALMKPSVILGPIIGNGLALLVLGLFNGGTTGPVSPGSIISLILMSPQSAMITNILAYTVSAAASFVVVAFILKRDKAKSNGQTEGGESIDLEENNESKSNEETEDTVDSDNYEREKENLKENLEGKTINKIVIACDAGMGSSVMGASILRKKVEKAKLDVDVDSVTVNSIPNDVDLIITNKILEDRAKQMSPNKDIPVVPIKDFLNNDEYDNIIQDIEASRE